LELHSKQKWQIYPHTAGYISKYYP